MTAPDIVVQLIQRFQSQLPDYRAGRYNETQLRRDYLDPFFEALGWDMTNRKNYSEKYREVVHEVSVEVEGQAKAADYAFQSGGSIFFFLEAKKPAVNIETNPDPAFQIRRYAWSAKVPVSLLSDFEQLAVYDCREKPTHSDPASYNRVNLYSYRDYAEKWDEIYDLFSHQAVHQGSLDRYAVTLKGKRGTADVDDDFLAEMERWRADLARNIALRNPGLTTRDINFAVQMTIDRIIFLRICEDRGIEPENALRDATDGKDVYGDLLVLFNQADRKYNSGLFHFSAEKGQSSHPDTLTPTLRIDDKVFKDILANLYYPKSPYAFKYIPIDLLGQIYERFLGKVIRLTSGHQARVEEKPEVRKAGGVYYTPTYIVDYIVKNTVGELLKDKDPQMLERGPLRVLDPACGSGSFLLDAYQYLLDWYLDWYVQHDPARWSRGKNPPIFESRDTWQLTMEKKKDILTGHIFGVDIDPQAVEVTKLSLLLKVVENPGQLSLMSERILPDLGRNIQCGNSLIGPDYYDDKQAGLFDSEEQYRVNAFDWKAAFPQVFRDGGFDAVIGNPPYGANLVDGEKEYIKKHFVCQNYQLDSYLLFLEISTKKLLKNYGMFGMIIPNPWLTNILQTNTRRYIVENTRIVQIVHFKYPVFLKVTVDTQIVILQNANSDGWLSKVKFVSKNNFQEDIYSNDNTLTHNQNIWRELNGGVINIFLSIDSTRLANKIHHLGIPLEEFFFTNVGIKPYQVGKGKPPQTKDVVKKRPFDSSERINDTYLPYLRGSDIRKYVIFPIAPRFIKYGPWLAEPRPAANFFAPEKIFMRQTGDSLVAVIDTDKYLCLNNMHILVPKQGTLSIHYFLGLINSKMMNWFYRTLNPETGEALAEVKKTNIANLPICTIDFTDPADVKRHDRMVSLVQTMLDLHKQLANAQRPDHKERLDRQIAATDRQIDTLVYDLYNLTPDEINIIESS
ncbi:MAG: Eco57I restriction-modification methylase domain-containing protein [Bellilinea sp.]